MKRRTTKSAATKPSVRKLPRRVALPALPTDVSANVGRTVLIRYHHAGGPPSPGVVLRTEPGTRGGCDTCVRDLATLGLVWAAAYETRYSQMAQDAAESGVLAPDLPVASYEILA